jgi:parvulin-like peptidyl-prolyl isomerase
MVVAVSACDRPVPPDTVVRLGKEDLGRADFQAFLDKNLGKDSENLESEVFSQLFDQFLDEALLSRLAADRKLTPADARSRQAVAALLAKNPPSPPSGEEVRRYFEAHATELARPERVKLRQILTDTRQEAERALAELASGGAFSDVARRHSHDPAASRGGDQGELARQDLPPSFAETIFALGPGEVSAIIAADYGFHLFQVVEKLPAETLTLEQAQPLILPRLEREQTDRAIAQFVAEARKAYNPVIYEENLPFKYLGRYASP